MQKDDIEMIRQWRNSPDIKRYALNQEHITKKQQKAWFERINKDEYFIILQKQPIGLIWFNIKDNLVETGFYIYDLNQQNSLLPYKIVTMFHDYIFNVKQFKSVTCKIQKNNKRAIRFNESLGYKKPFIVPGIEAEF
jgi:RimJ/RimL family protein N-acetyltransferase